MANLEMMDGKSFREDLDESAVKEFSTIQDKLKSYYLMRQQVGRGVTFGDKLQRQEKLEYEEKVDIEALNALSKEIDTELKAMGMQFDSETGEVKVVEGTSSVNDNTKSKLESISTELETAGKGYTNVSKALYGDAVGIDNMNGQSDNDGMNDLEHQTSSVQGNSGLVQINTEAKQNAMRRDVLAKNILQERINLEAVKDKMDMDAAIHVVNKNALMLRIEQLKLQIARSIAQGDSVDDPSVRAWQDEISGLINQISKLENEFEQRRDSYMVDFISARSELENSQKSIELERKSAGVNNKYQRNLTYSQDGILNGSTIEGKKDGRTFNEEEIYDERGVMIFDVADVVSRTKSINVDGTVVKCTTEFAGHDGNFDDSYYIGEMERLSVSSESNQTVVEEKPDIEEMKDNTEANAPIDINMYQAEVENMFYEIAGLRYMPDTLNQVPIEQRYVAARALELLGFDMRTMHMSPESLALMHCSSIALAAAREAMNPRDDDFGEIVPPPNPYAT